jgi:phosphoribosylformylglycinamidine synthase
VALDASIATAEAFGEDQGRYVLTAPGGVDLSSAVRIGTVGGSTVAGVELAALREANESFFRDWMES